MKFLFSFESTRMPLRSATIINWLLKRGHDVDVLYDRRISNGSMEGRDHLSKISVCDDIEKISNINTYDVWIVDLLNYKNYGEKSYYNRYFHLYKNILCVISFDDGSDFFDHRLNGELYPRVNCWLNNLLEKDKFKYHSEIREKCMLIPTYIEASNDNYQEFIHVHKQKIKPFLEKENQFYFSGAITGCIPAIDCRVNSILHLVRNGKVPYNVRVTGTDPAPFLEYLYDFFLDSSLKKPQLDRLSFLHEMNDHRYILSPKGNCQPLRRQYESFAFNNLIFINENNTVDYLFEGMPDVHFVKYKLDCSDLKEKIHYYHDNLNESQKIADAGTRFWHENCRIYIDGSLSTPLENYLLSKFKEITNVSL
jgi:hypothetical protein